MEMELQLQLHLGPSTAIRSIRSEDTTCASMYGVLMLDLEVPLGLHTSAYAP